MTSNKNFKDQVYKLVRKIPKGKVATYGQIAIALGRQTRFGGHLQTGFGKKSKSILARTVGNALHRNVDPSVPCHRVVDRNGRLASNFAFNGAKEQRRRVIAEGVKFSDNMHVDLEVCKWQS